MSKLLSKAPDLTVTRLPSPPKLVWYRGQRVHVRAGRPDGYEATIVFTDQTSAWVLPEHGRPQALERCADLARKRGRPPKESNVLAFPGAKRGSAAREAQLTDGGSPKPSQPAAPEVRPSEDPWSGAGENVTARVDGGFLYLAVNLRRIGNPSSTGKTLLIGTTHGTVPLNIPDRAGLKIQLNVMVPRV